MTLSAPGAATETTSVTEYFSTSPFHTYGSIDNTGTYGFFTATGTLPTAVHVGDSGPLSTDVYYADASKASVTMNATTSWEIQDDDSTDTAWACSKTVAREVGSNSDLLQTLRFRINTADDVLAAKVVLTTPAGTLEFRYTLRARQRALRHRPWLPTERVTLWRLRVESKVSAARSRQCGATRFAFLDDGPVRCR